MKSIATASIQSTNSNYKHLIKTGTHQLVADEPTHAGGQNAGPAPYDYLLAGLAACTAITLKMYADKKGWALGEVNIELDLQKNREGDTHIERVLHISETLTDEQWQKLIEIAGKTPVTKTLLAGATINTTQAPVK